MSWQEKLSDEEEQIIKVILKNHEIDFESNNVSIHISESDDYAKGECIFKINIYVQVN